MNIKKIILSLVVLSSIVSSCNNQTNETLSDPTTIQESAPEIADTISQKNISEYFTTNKSRIQIKDILEKDKTGFCLYFSMAGNTVQKLKLHIQYQDHIAFQFSVDRDKYTYKANHWKGSGERKVCWYDFEVKTNDMKLIKALLKSESGSIVFNDGTSTPVTKDMKDGIKRTLEYYQSLGGELPPLM